MARHVITVFKRWGQEDCEFWGHHELHSMTVSEKKKKKKVEMIKQA
jgi:hypothetical protein